jgi:multidrug resistance protein, MATE family
MKNIVFSHPLFLILRISIPILITNIATGTMPFIDTIFLGHLGTDELAASSIGSALARCSFYIILGLSSGLETLMNQAYGSKKYSTIGIILQRCLFIQTVLFIPLLFVLFFIEPLMLLCGQDASISALTAEYVRVMAFGWCAEIYSEVLIVYLNSQMSIVPTMCIVVITNIFNVFELFFKHSRFC